MKRIRHLLGGIARTCQSAAETDFVASSLKNQDVLLKVAEELLKQQTMQSVALARLEGDLNRLKADLKRLEEIVSKGIANPRKPEDF
jgi:translation elongation factor EF-Ts